MGAIDSFSSVTKGSKNEDAARQITSSASFTVQALDVRRLEMILEFDP